MGVNATALAMLVTIGGSPYPLAVVSSMGDCLAPEADSADIYIPWGDRDISGSSAPTEALPAVGADVVITCGGYTWRGTLTSRNRVAAGVRRGLKLQAHGPSIYADRAYLTTFARYGVSGTVVQTAGGPRFAPGTRSASPDGPGGTYVSGGTDDWTVGQGLNSLLAHASQAGLPAITLDASGATLTRILPDTDCDGISFHASLQAIMAHRMGLVWRLEQTATGWVLRVRDSTATGSALDLTTGTISGYSITEDNSAALASLEVRGGRRMYVISVDAYTGGSGNLSSDWNSGDVAARTAGDSGSPAYRRFKLTTFALPDGSSSTIADPVQTLPIAISDTLTSGSSPWLVFAQKTSDSSWISLQGKVTVSASGTRVWIEGIDPAQWSTWNRIKVTMCLSPKSYVSTERTGGTGVGRGLAVVAHRHAYASGAAVRISGSSLATVTGDVINEVTPISESADALWATLSEPQWLITWTEEGIASTADPPGTRKTSLSLPVPGTTPTTVPCDCIVSSRRIGWSAGRPRTTWSAIPRPYATGVLTR